MITNVLVSVYSMEYNEQYNRSVVSDTSSLDNVEAYLMKVQPTLESEIARSGENSRAIQYRCIVTRTGDIEDLLVAGAMIAVTHKRHRDANCWVEQTTQEQYILQSENDVNSSGREINFGLIRKDQQ